MQSRRRHHAVPLADGALGLRGAATALFIATPRIITEAAVKRPATLVIFDVLQLGNDDLRGAPLLTAAMADASALSDELYATQVARAYRIARTPGIRLPGRAPTRFAHLCSWTARREASAPRSICA
jgi:hypothetical protein